VLHVVVTGELTGENMVGFFEKLVNHAEWRPDIPILDDCTGIDVSKIDVAAVRMVADEFKLLAAHFRDRRFAIITPKAVQFGIVRQFMTYVDLGGSIPPHVFSNENDAITWLMS
jgi:hypothetical protein